VFVHFGAVIGYANHARILRQSKPLNRVEYHADTAVNKRDAGSITRFYVPDLRFGQFAGVRHVREVNVAFVAGVVQINVMLRRFARLMWVESVNPEEEIFMPLISLQPIRRRLKGLVSDPVRLHPPPAHIAKMLAQALVYGLLVQV